MGMQQRISSGRYGVRAEMIGFPKADLPFVSDSNRQFLFARFSLFACFCLALNLANAQVTELPPIKKPEKSQGNPGGNLHIPSSVNAPVKKKLEAPSKPSSGSHGEMSDLSASDRALIAKACRPKQYRGPVAFHDCEREQADAARNSAPVSFMGVSDSDRSLIAKACRAKQYYGPAAFRSCERDHVEALKTSPIPSFDGVSSANRSMIAKACRSKQYYGPAAHRACQRDQVSQLKSSQSSTSARRQ